MSSWTEQVPCTTSVVKGLLKVSCSFLLAASLFLIDLWEFFTYFGNEVFVWDKLCRSALDLTQALMWVSSIAGSSPGCGGRTGCETRGGRGMEEPCGWTAGAGV